jgi:C-terminal processing protease CtpA/Prc
MSARLTPMILATLLFPPGTASAQERSCQAGPGAAFGVTAYHCASCGIETGSPDRITVFFHTEPIVLETARESALRPGDIVEAVDGHPILTARGAQAFAYPPPGEFRVTVRRDGERRHLAARVTAACEPASADARSGRPRAGSTSRAEPADTGPGRFGFALACKPSCTRTRASDGTVYYRFDGHPPVAEVRPNGPADRAGLRVGDIVREIDGRSILEEAGVLPFLWSSREVSRVRLTIQRGGVERTLDIRAE